MKLQIKLTLILFTIFLVGWMIFGLSSFVLEQRNARQDIIRTAELLLTTASATRDYTSKQINPLLKNQETQEFIPESVPSYAAQQILERVRKSYKEYKGYQYAERALNPTNPNDLAEGWQVELIQNFIQNSDTAEKIGQRLDVNGQETLYVARPIRIESASCLKCHSTPDVAPASLIKSYGSSNGFNWKLNEVIGARIISVPTSVQYQQARISVLSYLLMSASVFLVAYTAIIIIIQQWITKPLDVIIHLIEEISLHHVEGSQLPENDSGSLGKLNRAINRLLISLNKALESVKK